MLKINEIRTQFPIVNEMAYFDIAYGNPLPKCTRDAMTLFMSILQKKGCSIARAKAYEKLDEARYNFANLINASVSEIAFVKNTSEGLNFAANGIQFNPGDNVVLNELEHLNNTFCWLRLRKKDVEVRIVPQNNGIVEVDEIASNVDSRTKAVAVASTTNLGFRFDLEKLGKICKENSAYFIVDAIQSLGIEPLDVKKVGVDMLSSSAHKGLLGPHGIGFFYCNEEILDEIEPLNVARTCYEPFEDPRTAKLKYSAVKFEGGNYNYAGVYGVAAGLKLLEQMDIDEVAKHSFELSEKFRKELITLGVNVTNSPKKEERSHIVTFNLPGKSVEKVKNILDENNVRVSAHYGVVRASFTHYNTIDEVKKALKILEEIK